MSPDIRIHYRGLPPSDAVSERIREHYAHLCQTFQRQAILDAHCYLELVNHRAGKSGCYRTTVDVSVPGRHLVVGLGGGRQGLHQDAHAALTEAFEAMERRLREYSRRLRNDVKHREPAAESARVVRLFPQQGYGFLETESGREVYFDENAVLAPGFDRLAVGSRVRFSEELGEEGPQATTVHIA